MPTQLGLMRRVVEALLVDEVLGIAAELGAVPSLSCLSRELEAQCAGLRSLPIKHKFASVKIDYDKLAFAHWERANQRRFDNKLIPPQLTKRFEHACNPD